MDFSYILKTAKILPEKLADFGFEKNGESFLCRKNLAKTDFYVVLKLESENLSAEVFEKTTDERYVLFDVESAKGSFVCSVRKQVLGIIDKFQKKCCVSTDVKKKYVEFIQERFGINGDNPWQETPEYTVFRCENKKWFALVMKIKFRQLGIFGDEDVFVVNLKSDCEKIPEIVDKKTVFPAWHMNKKYWITVLLTSATDWKKLCELTERSFELVNKKKSRIKMQTIEIREYSEKDLPAMCGIWNEVVEDGIAFPQEETLTHKEAESFFAGQTFCAVAEEVESKNIVGLYILHPNNIGRCGHIANASYAVSSRSRGLHIGERLVKNCIEKAHEKGFRILQFNAVVATNIHALHLYERLGFIQLGTIKGGFRMKDGSFEDICPYYREV